MKAKLFILIALLFGIMASAQQSINYKALIKDDSGNAIANQSVTIQFTIRRVDDGSIAYQEDHDATTDTNGILIVDIGSGNMLNGDYNTINWGSSEHVLNVQIDSGSGLVDIGTTQFKAVPYALYAENSGTSSTGLESLDEGNGQGWRLIGRNPDHYGSIGLGAVDLSLSNTPSEFNGALGNYSFAAGNFSRASALNSIALGYSASAYNTGSVAIGTTADAGGSNSIALGFHAQATGSYATAIGYYAIANQTYALASGESTLASGPASVAMGAETIASGNSSFAMGDSNTAAGNSSVALGFQTNVTHDYSFAMGNNVNVSAFAASAFGYDLINDDTRSFLVGKYNDNTTTSSSLFMVGNGVNTTNRSNAFEVLENGKILAPSLDVGEITDAKSLVTKEYLEGNYIGITSTEAPSGLETLNEGNGPGRRLIGVDPANYGNIGNFAVDLNTSDVPSTTIGATGGYSTAFGRRTTASGYASTAIGIGTIADGQSQLVIGQYNNPWGTGVLFQIGDGQDEDNRGTAFLVFEGGDALLTGSLTQNSDRRLKQNIIDLDYGLKEVLQLKPMSYHWKKSPDKRKSLGLIAQDVQSIIKEIVHVAEDEDKTLSVSYIELIPVLIKAIQEQQAIIDKQAKTIQNQEKTSTDQALLLQMLIDRVEALENHKSSRTIELVKN